MLPPRARTSVSVIAPTAPSRVLSRKCFPAFTNWLGVTVYVDIFQPFDLIFDRLRGVGVFLLHRFEERPHERQRKKAPVDITERRFHFDFFLLTLSRIPKSPSDRQTNRQRSDN